MNLFSKYDGLISIKKQLANLYSEKIDLNIPKHKTILIEIWNHFNKNEENKIELVDNKWLNLGFQGKDPLTDFRGTGLLGLKQLHRFSLGDLRSDYVYKVATDQSSWYFFAATSINITGKVINFIEKNFCDEYLFNNYQKINIEELSFNLYREFFCNFNRIWVENKYNDFMKVNTLLEDFMKKDADKIYQKVISNGNDKKTY